MKISKLANSFVISTEQSEWRNLLLAATMLLTLGSCSKILYVPVESVRTEYKNIQFRDSVYVLDSMIIRTKADTVWYEKYKTYYKDRWLRDSLVIIDSIQVSYPVEVVKEVNKLHWWQQLLIVLGSIFIGYLGFKIIYRAR